MEWKTVKLGEVAYYVQTKSRHKELTQEDYISTENMLPNKRGIIVASSTIPECYTKFQPCDILISNIRPYFQKIWFANRYGGCSNDVLCIRGDEKVIPVYLYYLLSQDIFFDYVMAGSKGTKMPRGDKNQIMQYEFPLPPLETQRRIAAILSSLDDKIENNNRINRNLEAQAQALFKSWFVDFEPFGGKMPEDWREYELGEFLPVITGKKDANIASKTGTYPFFSCAQDILYTDNYSFDANAILVAGNGDFNVKWYRGKFEAYQRTYVLIPNNSRYLGWLFYMVKHNLNNITCGARGSVIKFITKGNLENFRFAAPMDLTNCDIIDKFNTINQTIENNRGESARLAALRDTLLPKLMKGEIEV